MSQSSVFKEVSSALLSCPLFIRASTFIPCFNSFMQHCGSYKSLADQESEHMLNMSFCTTASAGGGRCSGSGGLVRRKMWGRSGLQLHVWTMAFRLALQDFCTRWLCSLGSAAWNYDSLNELSLAFLVLRHELPSFAKPACHCICVEVTLIATYVDVRSGGQRRLVAAQGFPKELKLGVCKCEVGPAADILNLLQFFANTGGAFQIIEWRCVWKPPRVLLPAEVHVNEQFLANSSCFLPICKGFLTLLKFVAILMHAVSPSDMVCTIWPIYTASVTEHVGGLLSHAFFLKRMLKWDSKCLYRQIVL